MAVDPAFVALATANLAYWRRRAQANDGDLDQEYANLWRAVMVGLALPETAVAAAELISQIWRLIERHGDWQWWQPALEHGVGAAAGRGALEIELLVQLGVLQRQRGQLEAAKHSTQRALALAREQGEHRWQIVAQAHLGDVCYFQRAYSEAASYAQAALEEAAWRGLGEARWLASIHNTLGLVAQATGAYTAACAHFEQAAAGWHTVGDGAYWARTLSNWGIALQRRGQFAEALAQFEMALLALGDVADPLQQARIWLNSSAVHLETGDWQAAETCLRRADTPEMRRLSDGGLQAMIANNLGYALRLQERSAEALVYLNMARQLWERLDNGLQLGNTLGEIAIAYARLKEEGMALAYFGQAEALLTDFPDNAWARQVIAELQAERAALPDCPSITNTDAR